MLLKRTYVAKMYPFVDSFEATLLISFYFHSELLFQFPKTHQHTHTHLEKAPISIISTLPFRQIFKI